MDAPSRPRRHGSARIGRRALLAGSAAAVATAAFVEHESLDGRFDHRVSPGASGAGRYAASLATLDAIERGPDVAAKGSIVHVGHSTHLVCVGGLRLLTDPWFYDPAFGALKHELAPAVLPNDIGRLDVVLITHDHADHADARALDQLDKRALVIVATDDLAARVRNLGYREVIVLRPWEEAKIKGVTITAVPGLHDIYEIGYVARGSSSSGATGPGSGAGGPSVYFAGDSRLHPDLPAIAERFAPDVAILSCDGTRLAGGALHVMTPADAVTASRTLKSRLVLPSHAEAVFSDPLVARTGLATTIDHARFLFVEAMGSELPGTRCLVPLPGELVSI